jgi:hypothetical protein
MEAASELVEARDQALRKIGRNVVNFQKMVTAACFLFLIFSSKDTASSWPLLRFVGVLAVIGAVGCGGAGTLNPPI